MESPEQLKGRVLKMYNHIPLQNDEMGSIGLSLWRSSEYYSALANTYKKLDGYFPSADLALGCGTPTEFAAIKEGDTVVDLGAGAGIDCFIAQTKVGKKGHIIGVDFADQMINRAKHNLQKLGYENVEFFCQDIENLSLKSGVADVVISNCTLNLVPDKTQAFKEIFRLLKNGGHFCFSDIVVIGAIPEELRRNEMLTNCIAGASQLDDYVDKIKELGFKDLKIKQSKRIRIPEEILSLFLSDDKVTEFTTESSGIFTATLFAVKP